MDNIPNIRFKGYTEPWERRKLIDICDYVDYRGKTPEKTDSGIFLVTAKNVKDGYIDYESSEEYISEEDYEKVMHRGFPKIGDVLITTEAPCGNVAQVNKEDIALAQRIIKYRGKTGIVSNTYLKHYMLAPKFQSVLGAKSSGGTVKGIKGSILHQQYIELPIYSEQAKIVQYLEYLSYLITLHQRKCDETKELKKYMLQKLFPKKDCDVPEIRFEGYNESWVQRKFEDFIKNVAKKNKNNLALEPYAVTNDRGFIAQKEAHDDFGYMSNVDRTAYNIVPPNSFAYNPARINVGSLGYYKGTKNVIVSSLYEVFQTEEYIDDKFLLHWFKSDAFPRWIEKLQEGSVRLYFYFDKLVQCQMMVPSIEEQKRISAYLDNLDNLIIFNQHKCDELKELKKYMLSNMFPKGE